MEINPRDANNAGVRNNEWVWLEGPEGGRIRIKALVTRRVAAGTVFTPFHFGGHFQGEDLLAKYPEGASPTCVASPTIPPPPMGTTRSR